MKNCRDKAWREEYRYRSPRSTAYTAGTILTRLIQHTTVSSSTSSVNTNIFYPIHTERRVLSSVRITKMLMGAHSRAGASEKKFPPPGGPEKLKVGLNCLDVTVKIMFKWYNNVVATNIVH